MATRKLTKSEKELLEEMRVVVAKLRTKESLGLAKHGESHIKRLTEVLKDSSVDKQTRDGLYIHSGKNFVQGAKAHLVWLEEERGKTLRALNALRSPL